MITLTCGHTVEDFDDASDIALASYNREGNRCVDYVSYCDECYNAALDRGEVLLTVDDEDVWLQSCSAKDEVECLRAKKKLIYDELYDKVKKLFGDNK